MTLQKNIYLLTMVIGVYVFSWFIQNNLFMNWDVSYLLNATKLLLAGGSYTNDFFNPNPPMILYLYTPPVILSKILNIDIILIFRIYIFFIASISLLICYFLIRNEMVNLIIFMLILASIYLVVPLYEFGQREHLLVMLGMPYLLLVVYRLSEKYKLSPVSRAKKIVNRDSFLIGLLAGLGYAIKPYFLVTPIMIELYYIWHTKNGLAWVRIETLTILSVFIVHIVAIAVFYPDYFLIVFPLLIQLYHCAIGQPLMKVICYPLAVFCWVPLLLYIVQYKMDQYKILRTILLITLISFLISYYAQRSLYYYHLIPAFSFMLMLLVLQFNLFASRNDTNVYEYGLVILLEIVVLMFLFYCARSIWTTLIFHPIEYFLFFGMLFMMLFYMNQSQKNIWIMIAYTAAIILISVWCSFVLRRTDWHPYEFFITTTIMIILFGVLEPKTNNHLYGHILTATLGMLIFAFPFYMLNSIYLGKEGYKDKINHLVNFINSQGAHQPISFFSTTVAYALPATQYSKAILGQRFDCLWMVAGLVNSISMGKNDTTLQQRKYKNFVVNGIAEDLHVHKPALVFIDVNKYKPYIKNIEFDYLKYFSENYKFRTEWKRYSYLTTIKEAGLYTLDVYERK